MYYNGRNNKCVHQQDVHELIVSNDIENINKHRTKAHLVSPHMLVVA